MLKLVSVFGVRIVKICKRYYNENYNKKGGTADYSPLDNMSKGFFDLKLIRPLINIKGVYYYE